MLNWFKPRRVVETRVLEVPLADRVLAPNEEDRSAVASLETHPGMRWIFARLRLQHQFLKDKLTRERQKDLHEVEFIQSGIFWTRWLEDQVRREIARDDKKVATKPLTKFETDAIEAAQAAIEVIGAN